MANRSRGFMVDIREDKGIRGQTKVTDAIYTTTPLPLFDAPISLSDDHLVSAIV